MPVGGVAPDAWIKNNSVINVVLKVMPAANWLKLEDCGFSGSLITNLAPANRCGELEDHHQHHQRRLEGDDGGESAHIWYLGVFEVADQEYHVVASMRCTGRRSSPSSAAS